MLIKNIIVKSRLLRILGDNDEPYRQRFLYSKYKKKFKSLIEEHKITAISQQKCTSKTIFVWVYWHQGLGTAPNIIKACVNSVRTNLIKTNPKYKLIVLSKDNLNQYVKMPDFIENKLRNGSISITHYSDILRTYLLIKFGGYWIDSTVFLSHKSHLFDVIENTDFFVFKSLDLSKKYYNKIYISNWFIYSRPNNKILSLTLKLLYKYWETTTKLDDYFIYHILFSIAADVYKEQFDKIPTYNNCSPHTLQFEMFNAFNQARFEQIKDISSIHKLNREAKPVIAKQIYTFNDYIIEKYSN